MLHQRKPVRESIDRPNLAPGQQPQRPLLSYAAAAISSESNSSTAPSSSFSPTNSTASTPKRKDSTENGLSDSSTSPSYFRATLKNLIPTREQPQTSSQLWHRATSLLKEGDLQASKRVLLRLYKHRSTSLSAAYNRCRAVTVLSIISLVREWDSTASLSTATSKRLTEAVLLGSKDGVALAVWLHLLGRWHLPSSITSTELFTHLEKSGGSGHPGSQALLGSILCISPVEAESRADGKSGEATRSEIRHLKSGNTPFVTPPKRRERKPSVPFTKRHMTAGSVYLQRAASKGYFLAIEHLERTILRGLDNEKVQFIQKKGEKFQQLAPWIGELVVEPLSCYEFFACVQNAANEQIPDCAVRVSRLLRKGIGCEQSDEDAFRWIKTAAELNVPAAVSAVHAEALRENLEMTAILAPDLSREQKCLPDVISQIQRARLKVARNKEVIRTCEKKMLHWRGENPELHEILTLYRICNLQTQFSESMCQGLVRLIFERDRDGWYISE